MISFQLRLPAAAVLVFLNLLLLPAAAQELTPLSDATIDSIAASRDRAQWERIQVVTDKQAGKLRKSDGVLHAPNSNSRMFQYLWLPNLKVITENQAYQFKQFEGTHLLLDGLDTLTKAVARTLNNFWPKIPLELVVGPDGKVKTVVSGMVEWKLLGVLSLNGIKMMTDEVADAFGKAKCTAINLNGLIFLTEMQAKKLAKFQGMIDMRNLDEQSVLYFLKYKGHLQTPGMQPLEYDIK